MIHKKVAECTRGEPTVKSISDHAGARSTQHHHADVCLTGERGIWGCSWETHGTWTVQHPSLKNRNSKTRIFSDPQLCFLFISKFKTTDRQAEGEEDSSNSSHYIIATGQKHCTLMSQQKQSSTTYCSLWLTIQAYYKTTACTQNCILSVAAHFSEAYSV